MSASHGGAPIHHARGSAPRLYGVLDRCGGFPLDIAAEGRYNIGILGFREEKTCTFHACADDALRKLTLNLSFAVLDQRECRFEPHVLGLQVGQPLRILNSDSTLHNVHALAHKNAPFNVGVTRTKPELVRLFDSPEVMVPLHCNVHPWMVAYVGVVAHPYYAVTDSRKRRRDMAIRTTG